MAAERRRLSVTITGPEVDMLEAIAALLLRDGYLVLSPAERQRFVTVTRKSRDVLNALRSVSHGQLAELARSWRFAVLEQVRREAEPDVEVER